MRISQILIYEHKMILKGVEVLDLYVQRMIRGEEVNPKLLLLLIDYLKNFADKAHHAKEEDVLFIFLEKQKILQDSPVIKMVLEEHDLGRGWVGEMVKAIQGIKVGERLANQKFLETLKKFIRLLRHHIYKEDHWMERNIDDILSTEQQDILLEKFKEVAQKEYEREIDEKFKRVLRVMELHASAKFPALTNIIEEKILSLIKDRDYNF